MATGACVNEQYSSCGCDLTQILGTVAARCAPERRAAWPLKQQLSVSRYHPGSVGQGACTSLCLRQDRPRGVRDRPDGPRRRAGRQWRHRESPGRGRDRSHGSCPDHRCAGDAGRAREDLAPGHPCRHPGRPVEQVPSRGPRRPGHHSHRPCRLQPVPVRGATFRRDDGRRRSDDDPGHGEELRVRHGCRSPRRVRDRLGGAEQGRRRERVHSPQAGACRLRPHCRLRRRDRSLAGRDRTRCPRQRRPAA